MQAVADLAFFQLAQVVIGAVEQQLLFFFAARRCQAEIRVEIVFDDQGQHLLAQQCGAARIKGQRLVKFVDQPLQVPGRPVAFGTGQRRHQVIDDHSLGAALGLAAFAWIVDDERIEMRQRTEDQLWPALFT